MQRYLLFVDNISTWVGKAFGWLIVVLTVIVCYDVVWRYAFNSATDWAFDTSYMLYGALFMMCGAYTLAQDGHVRGDFLYNSFRPRVQAGFDLALYFLFFLPGTAALAYAGIDFARTAWVLREHSALSAGGPPLYHFKTLIPIAGALMLLQGLVEITRCVICLKTGQWPRRLKDVEEIDIVEMQLKQSLLVDEAEKQRVIEKVHELESGDPPPPGHQKGSI